MLQQLSLDQLLNSRTAFSAKCKPFSFKCMSSQVAHRWGFLTYHRFMAADALWTLAMACNVYLTFYHKFDADKLRSIEKWYFLGCYGVPFVPAFLYIWAHEPDKPRLYGNATLWCWVTSNYDVWRIGTFYGPVW
jgi:hypothetical protein